MIQRVLYECTRACVPILAVFVSVSLIGCDSGSVSGGESRTLPREPSGSGAAVDVMSLEQALEGPIPEDLSRRKLVDRMEEIDRLCLDLEFLIDDRKGTDEALGKLARIAILLRSAKDANDEPDYAGFHSNTIKSLGELADQLRAGDFVAASKAYDTMAKTCEGCHDKYRKK